MVGPISLALLRKLRRNSRGSMKFGAHFLPTHMPELDGPVSQFYQRIFEQIESLERLGFDRVWITEHHFGDYGGSIPHPPAFLAAIACKTSRIRLGVAVAVLPLNNPIHLAESYGMVDVLSNGRLDFGIGKGSEPIEYLRFGAHREEGTQRMIEGAEILCQAWSDEPVNFHGEFFNYNHVRVLTKPVQRPHPPIWVGATRTEETFRWAGKNGFHLMTLPFVHPTMEALHDLVEIYRQALAQAGHVSATRQILGKVSHLCVGQFGARDTRGSSVYEELFGDPCCRRSQSKTNQSRYYGGYGKWIYHRRRSAALHRHNPPLAGGSRPHDVFTYLLFRWHAPGAGAQEYPAFRGAGYACLGTALSETD